MKNVLFSCCSNKIQEIRDSFYLVAMETTIFLINALNVTFTKATMFPAIKNYENAFFMFGIFL